MQKMMSPVHCSVHACQQLAVIRSIRSSLCVSSVRTFFAISEGGWCEHVVDRVGGGDLLFFQVQIIVYMTAKLALPLLRLGIV
jgi:hypothetical protein